MDFVHPVNLNFGDFEDKLTFYGKISDKIGGIFTEYLKFSTRNLSSKKYEQLFRKPLKISLLRSLRLSCDLKTLAEGSRTSPKKSSSKI